MMTTPNYDLPLITGNMSADVVRDMNALADAVDTVIKNFDDQFIVHTESVASVTSKGHVQLSSSISSMSETLAASSKAISSLRDYLAAYGFANTAKIFINGDLNNLENGFYYANAVSNLPENFTHGYVICVSSTESLKFQIFVNGLSTSLYNTKVYKRVCYNGVWNSWVSLLDSTDVTSGTGSPEGVVTAPIGTLYRNRNGGANTTLYVKQSGTGNVGWVAK